MTQSSQHGKELRFGDIEADLQTGELRCNGRRLRLREKPLQLLEILLERPGKVISKEELQRRLWPDVRVDADSGLGEAVYKLRQALGDSAKTPRYIETVPKRGYRFVATIEPKRLLTTDSTSEVTAPTKDMVPESRLRIHQGLLALSTIACLALALLHFSNEPPEKSLRRFSFRPPERLRAHEASDKDVSISPDGRYIAFVDEQSQLWLRDLEQEAAHAVPGVQKAKQPFWSPDSKFVIFGADSELKRVPVQGGAVTRICEISGSLYGGSVSPDGNKIVFAADNNPPRLYEVPFGGGNARPLHAQKGQNQAFPELATGEAVWSPKFLPAAAGDLVLLFAIGRFPDERTVVQDLVTGRLTPIGPGFHYVYSPSGHLIYQRASDLWAVPFSIERLKIEGTPFLFKESASRPSIAQDGTLVYRDPDVPFLQRFAVKDRLGRLVKTLDQPEPIALFSPIRISENGRLVAYERLAPESTDVWILDLQLGTRRRLTSDPAFDYSAVWSFDGEQIAFSSNREGEFDIFLRDREGVETESKKISTHPDREVVTDWSHDGKYLFYRANRPDTGADLGYLERTADGDWAAHVYLETPFDETNGRLSPNGRFVAYNSNESGDHEVYIRGFPDSEKSYRVSLKGGRGPRWNEDGSELFYQEGETIVAVSVSTDSKFPWGPANHLFSVQGPWEVFPDGQTFLVVEAADDPPEPTIRIVQNWHEEFRHREPQ